MVLHFVKDEKVVDQLIINFHQNCTEDVFLVFVEDNNLFKHIKLQNNNVIRFNYLLEDINSLLIKYKPSAILIHALYPEFAKTIIKIKKPINIGWFSWGFDVYSLPKISIKNYGPQTKTYLKKRDFLFSLKNTIRKYNFFRRIYTIITRQEDKDSIIRKSIKKINYFISYIEEDYEIYSKYYPNTLEFYYCTFSTINQYLAGNECVVLNDDSNGILIGNSNTPECNHLDVFKIINETLKEPIEISVILSYGPDERYKKEVIKRGNDMFGVYFKPIKEFIPRKNYIQLLQTCSVGVFYHYRQQAMGNIIAMLYLGARIYLSSKNPAYHFFIRNGIIIFDLDEDFEIFGTSKLEAEQVKINRNELNRIFGEDKVKNDINKLINTITEI